MMDAGRHPNVELLANTEVENIAGYVGNFQVRVRRKARFVLEDKCTACGDCIPVCPVTVPDEYQAGLATRRAIHIPFAQAVPSAYLIEEDECLGFVPIACGKCRDVCDAEAIQFDMTDEVRDLQVGAIVVATGLDMFDPSGIEEYGYGSFPNVITSMEFERLISAGGATDGHFVRPSDLKEPKRVAFVQCVGSRTIVSSNGNGTEERDMRNEQGHPYCSNICCMNTVKDSLLLLDHYPDTEIAVYYMDIRAFGKGFEDLYRRSRESGTRYIRGMPGEIREVDGTGDLQLSVENTMTGDLETHEHDLIVLSLGLVPPEDQDVVKRLLTLSYTSDGFFLESHPKLKPVDAPTKGVYLAGCAEGPKDVRESVTQASAAAARAQTVLNKRSIELEPVVASISDDICGGCGRCVQVCPFHAITGGDAKLKIAPELLGAVCQGCGTCVPECNFDAITIHYFTDQQILSELDAALSHNPEERVVAFTCNWCSYAGADFAGVSRLQYPASARIIRTMCSGRVDPEFVLRAFRKGAAVVLVSGCHFGDCHYLDANHETAKRMKRLWKKLERLGVRPERLRLEWVSAAEGGRWAQIMRELDELQKTVTLEEIEETKKALAPKSKKAKTTTEAAPA